ncbi:MAG: MerR family transcriptional regulator, partial [Acidimicrobiales bacterium]|nr:MerR family transcriptional regulator [Acidimicrobiales bacterium]
MTLSLSDLVEMTGVPASTIHYYRRAGLIPPPAGRSGTRFVYDEGHLEALRRLRASSARDHPDVRNRIVASA